MPIDLPPPPRQAATRPRWGAWPVLLLQLVTLGGLVWILFGGISGTGAMDSGLPERSRTVASKLKAAGALSEAAGLYERFLDARATEASARAAIAFSLGKLYLEQGRYEKALRWFYEAEALQPAELEEALGKKIVHALEALGRVHAAQAVLARRTQLAQPEAKRPEGDPVVARIGKDEIHRSAVMRAFDDLPPWLKQRFAGEAGLAEFLRKFVADELIYRKAQKLELDEDPQVRRQLEALIKQLVVARFIEKEIIGKLEVTQTDLENHFEANRERFDEPEALRLRLIKVAGKKKATELAAQLAKGASFAKLAGQASLDVATKDQGGLLDRWVKRGENFLGEGDPKEVSEAVFTTAKGQVSDPVPVGKHVYLFRVEDRRPGAKRTLEAVRKQVEADYKLKKTQAAYADLIEQMLSAEEVALFSERMEEEK